jgi:hypothetical protein
MKMRARIEAHAGCARWKRMPDPQLPIHAKMPFSCRVMRFARFLGRDAPAASLPQPRAFAHEL